MARVFVTGSADGLGLMAARLLVETGHAVVLHARSEARAEAARAAVPKAEAVLVGDLSTIAAMRDVARQANERGRFDAVIHNVGIGYQETARNETRDGVTKLWAVNVLAPYVLTALMHKPQRLVYLSSGMHKGGDATLDDLQWTKRRWNGSQAYADTKLHDVLLALGVARKWPDVLSNAMTPGWVPTRMGGKGAPDDLDQGHRTQVWLAVSEDKEAKVTGRYFYHLRVEDVNPAERDAKTQDRLIDYCREVSGIALGEKA
jgi:NAD(P)-dependent dehydrogenase (short-subunit alcohol dehydrogenase family)